jgi:hypothetical protein
MLINDHLAILALAAYPFFYCLAGDSKDPRGIAAPKL